MTEVVGVSGIGQALRAGRHELISLVGGGGKTTALFSLGRQLSGSRVLTTTTKMGRDRTDGLSLLVNPTDDELTSSLAESPEDPISLVWSAVDDHRALGVTPEQCDAWFGLVDHVVVEADGSRRHPFKAPARYEPVVPSATTLLVACIGISAVGQPIATGCHRPDQVAALAGCGPQEVLTPERAVRVLTSGDGSQKGRPGDARFAVLVNRIAQADHVLLAEITERIGEQQPETLVVGVGDEDLSEAGR